MLHAISLCLVLYATWLLLSGHYELLILALGLLSCIGVVAIALRMDVVDHEGHPIHLTWRLLLYWPWLLVEIIKSNVDVARVIIDPKLRISPCMIRVPTSQKTDVGRVIYANSITLTPGTVSVDVSDGTILVHAITEELAAGVESGEMDRRVAAVEGHG